ncbi:50S ribosomal protein L17 [Candidatus Uhrbacteria bacterium RIFCSPHIGHO2_12_FULL_57_11]|uniref:Large ribosomal subunit protein bL17 n=2 Tax=Candidatus Uhriibacteriota TaxID=1752732 RepID=A0A1F7UL04_9BACT|nr:MAG: 50S ribosomal protein L17 [Candidatus Uhrbacteria bacterium RIFCSPHIGHO2_02_FULL_57_19]OGL78966.1 MAG: 50S ribosomal protein L17 [Candidatus Uhrbacteria bacterium RIFCSPHIGHO2_12_FULL_57_11]
MRHRKVGKKLGRTTGPREALLRNLATSVILYERVRTTKAKARAVRPLVEDLVTIGKTPGIPARRRLTAILRTEGAVRKVVEVLGPRYRDRRGGYTRVTKIGRRQGDAAEIVQIEFV